jgi:hypothetical protein
MFKDFSTRQVLFFFIVWWLVWLGIEWYIVKFYGVTVTLSLVDTAVHIALLLSTSIGIYNTIRFYRPTRGNLLYIRIWALLHSWLITALHGWILSQIDPLHNVFVEQAWPIRYVFSFIMISISITGTTLFFYMVDEQEKEARKDDAEKIARETELIQLRQQLQPHFLFNSLNSISALAGSKPEQARMMIQQLSDFLRGTLRKDEQQLISLKDELLHLGLYLEIEKVRFGHRLVTHIDMGTECEQATIPYLLLQPIVENAIKFGLYDTTGEVVIQIQSRCSDQGLTISVTNPFDAETAQPRTGTGFGLSSVQRRLHLLYSRTDLLQTHSANNQFITTIHIPQAS